MKLHFLDRTDLQNKSISVHHNTYPNFLKVWHYHEQLELVAILKSKGTRFVGDSIEQFNEGEVVLIGKNLPHLWLNDKSYFKNNPNLTAEAVAIHFKEEFIGNAFATAPEMKHITALFDKAKQGLKFTGNTSKIIADIKELQHLNDFERIIKLMQILNTLWVEVDYVKLASAGFLSTFNQTENRSLDKVYSYIFDNFKKPISLQDMAKVAQMNPAAFSRYFKKGSRKPFSRYLNEVRVGYACKLLLEEKYNITDICYESGFQNLSNFNRQFKAITSYSPSDYLKKHSSTVK